MTPDGNFLLIRQERVPIKATLWEMPAGQIDGNTDPDEDQIREVARRELHEETGYDLSPEGEMIGLGYFFSSPGFTDEHCYFFLARPVQRSAVHRREEGEGILECRPFRPEQLAAMIEENEIRDSNTLSICARLAARGFLSFAPRR
jgi:ADP-ribose pyrophosphatase